MNLKQIIRAECANYFTHGPYGARDWCEAREMVCVAFGNPGPCNWLLTAVLPANPDGNAEYADLVGAKTEPVIVKPKVCQQCGEAFKPQHNRQICCSAACSSDRRARLERERKRSSRQGVLAEVA